MKLTFLGTSGWYDSPAGYTLCTVLETADFYLVLDAGGGFAFLDRCVKPGKPVYVFISHLHLDHVAGLHTLVKHNLHSVLFLLPDGYREPFAALINSPFTVPLSKMSYPASIMESRDFGKLPFKLTGYELDHSDSCWGFRLEHEGRVFSYGPDTGPCPNLDRLARNADLLLTECAYLPGEERPEWPHMNPELAAACARDSGAKRLILTHFDPVRYPDAATRTVADSAAKAIFANSSVAEDGLAITI
ncbi:MAG: MBL fold metallo-hydrolase [Elusimicrobiaceae bacterium]|nr:MBL fold metallo-hydrolase [Elusimicrobiaceae bacterium]